VRNHADEDIESFSSTYVLSASLSGLTGQSRPESFEGEKPWIPRSSRGMTDSEINHLGEFE
jgi:hypothetical protein